MMKETAVLDVRDLRITFPGKTEPAVDGVSFTVGAGEVLGVAGESGSGKSTIALAALGLLPPDTSVGGSIHFEGQDLLGLSGRRLRQLRGRGIAMVFQESVTALHPMRKIGDQLVRVVRAHFDISREEAGKRVAASLKDVRLEPERVMASFPHELSGGMCQRVMIAMALSCEARLILADEPTTALDVSLQKDILTLMRELVERRELSAMFISHDLAVLGDVSDRVMVLYRGEVKEIDRTRNLLRAPRHPYTEALLACVPRLGGERLVAFPEIAADQSVAVIDGACNYIGRCRFATSQCHEHPELVPAEGGLVRCWHPVGLEPPLPAGATAVTTGGDA